jgi:hypothetical protein
MTLMIAPDGGSSTAQVAMTLAAIAYADGHDIPSLLSKPALATQGRWRMRWLGRDDANQVYAAQDHATGQWAVCIRGSVTDPFTEAFWIDWLKQDLEVFKLKDWSYGGAPAGVKIAQGTRSGLESLIGLRDDAGRTLVEFLGDAPEPGHALPTAVIGHSLGGALASVLAPYLHQRFAPGQNVLDYWPVTFAGPTAGNTAFATWLEQSFAASAGRYFNTLDVVPHAWQALAWIARSFPDAGPRIPALIADLIKPVEELLRLLDDSYTQPGAGTALSSTIQQGANWFSEAGYQHSGTTYLALVGAPPVPENAPSTRGGSAGA